MMGPHSFLFLCYSFLFCFLIKIGPLPTRLSRQGINRRGIAIQCRLVSWQGKAGRRRTGLCQEQLYYNPCTDCPGTADDRTKYPLSYPSNKWPAEEMPQLEPAAKTMGLLLKNVTVKLAGHLDAYMATKLPQSTPPPTLTTALKDTEKVKCRLLYYFPKPNNDNTAATNKKMDSWIGWHNDSGFLTALAGEYYVETTTRAKY